MNEVDRLKSYRDKTVEFCSKLDYSSTILEQEFTNNTHDIYFAYPLLFIDVFPSAKFDPGFLEKLSIAGFLLYRSVIIQDRLTDNDDYEKVSRLGVPFLSNTLDYCRQIAIGILKELFPPKSEFWSFLEASKECHIMATQYEKTLHSITDAYKCISLFDNLSYFKAYYGRLSIDALFCHYIEDLDVVHYVEACFQHDEGITLYKQFAFLLQIVDDIDDINKDFLSGQANIAIKLTQILFPDCGDLQGLKKHFYFSGVAPCLFSKICSNADIITKGANDKF